MAEKTADLSTGIGNGMLSTDCGTVRIFSNIDGPP
jgi:hypothetical protein